MFQRLCRMRVWTEVFEGHRYQHCSMENAAYRGKNSVEGKNKKLRDQMYDWIHQQGPSRYKGRKVSTWTTEKHREYLREWRKKNPEKQKAIADKAAQKKKSEPNYEDHLRRLRVAYRIRHDSKAGLTKTGQPAQGNGFPPPSENNHRSALEPFPRS